MSMSISEYLTEDSEIPPEIFELKDAGGNPVPYACDQCLFIPHGKSNMNPRLLRFEFLAKVPAMGYAFFTLCPSFLDEPPKFDSAADLQIEEQSLENTFVKLAFNPNGTFNLTDKATGRQFENCHFFWMKVMPEMNTIIMPCPMMFLALHWMSKL